MNTVKMEEKKPETLKVGHALEGSIWADKAGAYCMLVQVGPDVFNFINLESGNRDDDISPQLQVDSRLMTFVCAKAIITITPV